MFFDHNVERNEGSERSAGGIPAPEKPSPVPKGAVSVESDKVSTRKNSATFIMDEIQNLELQKHIYATEINNLVCLY